MVDLNMANVAFLYLEKIPVKKFIINWFENFKPEA